MNIDKEELNRRVELYKQCGSFRKAAKQIGIDESALRECLQRASRKGLISLDPVMPGYRIKQVSSRTADGKFITQVADLEIGRAHV